MDDNNFLIGLVLILLGALIGFIMSYDKKKKSETVLAKTSRMNGWGLALLLIIFGLITLFQAC